MLELFKKIWILLSLHERKRAILLLLLMIAMALLEVLGISSIMPFLAVLGNPEVIHTNQYLSYLYVYLDFSSTRSFLIFLGFTAIGVLFFSAAIKTLSSYASLRFSNMRRHSIAQKLLTKYLHEPYSFFLQRNSSDISKTILSETDTLIGQIIVPSLNLVVYTILALFLLSFLIAVNMTLALILIVVFGGFYTIVYLTVRKYIMRIGEERAEANTDRFKIVLETIGGIKDLKVLGREQVYLDSFATPSYKFASYSATNQTLSQVPQFLVEVIAFGALLSMAMYALSKEGINLGELLPLLGLYALGALKLKPAINSIYTSLSLMKFGIPVLNSVLDDLQNVPKERAVIKNNNQRLILTEKLEFENIDFSYENTTKPALQSVNITVRANTTVGIIGSTGAGKSTLIDIILGLLSPTSGKITVDGEPLTSNNVRQWQNAIGYVPQSIFLADDTIANNIAFGVSKDMVDMKQVEEVAKMAQVHDFIITLPDGYNTKIGERGVRLSGGQRQRLGIARALYHNPELLVLDEATSALDNETESEVMKAINNMSGRKTIIMIAHRLSTVENCDVQIKLENGQVVQITKKEKECH